MYKFIVLSVACLAVGGCGQHQAEGKYPLGPCVGDYCLGRMEKDSNMEACTGNTSRVRSIVIRNCREVRQRVFLNGMEAVPVDAIFVNSYLAETSLKFESKNCQAVKAQLETQFGASPVMFFPTGGKEKSQATLDDMMKGYEWKTKNGRLALVNDLDNGKDVGFCWLQMNTGWESDEMRNSLGSDKSVSG